MHKEIRGRNLKRRIVDLLKSRDLNQGLNELLRLPRQRVIGYLFPLTANSDEDIKWHAVTAMGVLTALLAEEDLERARIVVRRMMWNLNDESGGIGWGAPECMGEIMACHEGLADEFAHVLVSYIREDGNFLEYELLQRGVLWGLMRLAETRPELARSLDISGHLVPYFQSSDAIVRGLAARVAGLIEAREIYPALDPLRRDHTEIPLYLNRKRVTRCVSELTEDALAS
ncbi:MAG: DVU0298 family protein [bacterium]